MSALEIKVGGDDPVALCNDLQNWLTGTRELRGRVNRAVAAPADGTLGSVTDVLEIALGSGGAGVALVQCLTAWIRVQKQHVKITVKRGTSTVDIDADNVDDAEKILTTALQL